MIANSDNEANHLNRRHHLEASSPPGYCGPNFDRYHFSSHGFGSKYYLPAAPQVHLC